MDQWKLADLESLDGVEGAYWLGLPEALNRKSETQSVFYRHRFDAPQGAQITMHISASDRYRLYLNGIGVHSGPCRSDGFRLYCDALDATAQLRAGRNELLVQVIAYADEPSTDAPKYIMPGGLGPQLLIQGAVTANGETIADISTGVADWALDIDTGLKFLLYPEIALVGSMEAIDGAERAKLFTGESIAPEKLKYEQAGYGIINRFPLMPRPIALVRETPGAFVGEMPLHADDLPALHFDVQGKAEIGPNETRVVELNAGELRTAFLSARMRGGKGAKLRFLYAECYSTGARGFGFLGRDKRDDWENGKLIGAFDEYTPYGEGEESFRPFLLRTFRFLRIEVRTQSAPLTLYRPEFADAHYPLDPTARFSGNGVAWANPLWEISLRTLADCTHETYEDCPYYEQLQYIMDTRLQALFTQAIGGDDRLMRKAIYDFHSSLLPEGIVQSRYPSREMQVIPVFALHWIFMLRDWVQAHGADAFARACMSTVDSILDWFARKLGEQGLVEFLGYWEFADWTEAWDDRHGTPNAVDHGPCTHHNLTYALALRTAAELWERFGRGETAREYEQRADALCARVNALCWDEEKSFYLDGPGFAQITQHAQVFAVLAGAVRGEKARALLLSMLADDTLIPCSYPLTYYVFRALEKTGLYAHTEKLWGKYTVLLDQNVTTWPEMPFNPRSECHAWGALPLYEFPRCALGVRSGAGDWDSIDIQPLAAYLGDVEGEAPTPRGTVHVRIADSVLSGEAPAGVLTRIRDTVGNVLLELPAGGAFSDIRLFGDSIPRG